MTNEIKREAAAILPKIRMMLDPMGKVRVSLTNEVAEVTYNNIDNINFSEIVLPATFAIAGVGTISCTKIECRCPLAGKIALVTGSAQGFGAGIAEFLASQGAAVCVADMNAEGAAKEAVKIAREYGTDVISVAANVTDEESVQNMINETVCAFGGLDVFVNNAGIVRAGSLEEMNRRDFELVTSVDYTAFFLCTKYAIAPMKAQRAVNPAYMSDIIEINSKSGLEGSNKNFAYAGAKFGGIGLTQSFALELAPFGIKVNAICPGNFLDGPLWSDPEKGLFVQYLNAGKVPGAKTVADVRAFYEAKVPLGRGCTVEDVAKAISYVIDQKYETGQAIPVTGGQLMLN